jgi:hypothetical protein
MNCKLSPAGRLGVCRPFGWSGVDGGRAGLVDGYDWMGIQ